MIKNNNKQPLPLDWIEDPVKFTSLCWPQIRLYDKQQEILYSVRDNVETFCHAANEMGKDFVTSLAVIWFFASRKPARVITSSSSETQLKSILWSEIRQRLETSKYKFPFRVSTLQMKRLNAKGEEDPLSYVIGHVTNTVESFQGHHLAHDKPRVLAVFDEASGIDDIYKEASESWAHRTLVIGNPLNTTNFFFKYCRTGDVADPGGGKGLFRKVIHIDAAKSPNYLYGEALRKRGEKPPYPSIIPGVCSHSDFQRRKLVWDKAKQTMRLHGNFFLGANALLFPPLWLDKAEDTWDANHKLPYDANVPETSTLPNYLGVDTGAGRDLTVWTVINRLGIVQQIPKVTDDTSVIPDITKALMKQFYIKPSNVAFDAGGGGKQFVDLLRNQRMGNMSLSAIRSVAFGSSPKPRIGQAVKTNRQKIEKEEDAQTFKNKRAQMYWLLRELVDETSFLDMDGNVTQSNADQQIFGIPRELTTLREELAVLQLLYDQEGKLYLPPKDDPPRRTVGNNHTEVITLKAT